MRFWSVWLFAVVQVHPIVNKTRTIVEMKEWIAGELLGHGRGGSDTVIVARPDQSAARQSLA